MDDDKLTPNEALARWGDLLHGPTRTYREFEEPDGQGLWRPVYEAGELKGYRRYMIRKLTKKVVWRKLSRRR